MSRELKTCRTICIGYRVGIATNWPEAFDIRPIPKGRSLMAQVVCERPECLRRAEREILRFTGEPAVLMLDPIHMMCAS